MGGTGEVGAWGGGCMGGTGGGRVDHRTLKLEAMQDNKTVFQPP